VMPISSPKKTEREGTITEPPPIPNRPEAVPAIRPIAAVITYRRTPLIFPWKEKGISFGGLPNSIINIG